MTLLAPLGLLGLLGVLVLIIIYILRPNYQQKMVPSTYIWKLSLKYRKKRLPTSKLRNILLILCQVLILISCAAILAKPARVLKTKVEQTEIIAILDSSASMQATTMNEEGDKVTRFQRALEQIQTLATETYQKDGIVSVILAEQSPSFLANETFFAQRVTAENAADLNEALQSGLKCSNGIADVDEAFLLCEDVLVENPNAKIYFYTDAEYGYIPEGITVVNMAEENEWNVAILDAYTEMDNNYYTFYVDVAYYGPDINRDVALTLKAYDANADETSSGRDIELTHTFSFSGAGQKKIVFITEANYKERFAGKEPSESETIRYEIIDGNSGQYIYSYNSVDLSITTSTDDSFTNDNYFTLFNGQKEIVKLQYASSNANPFFRAILLTMQAAYAEQWDIRITEVKKGDSPALEGFDFYIFEHTMPAELPTDGVAMLVNPDSAPAGSGFRVEDERTLRDGISLTSGDATHPILKHVTADDITVSRYKSVTCDASKYEELLFCDGSPVLLLQDDGSEKTLIMTFSIHYSNLVLSLGNFPLLMCNIFDYFFPVTVSDYVYEVNEIVQLNARGSELTVRSRDGTEVKFDTFPTSFEVTQTGRYVLTQKNPFTNADIIKEIYVKIPSAESDIFAMGSALTNPYKKENESDYFKDLLLYLASALVALLFIEWWLQSRETI